VYALSNNHVLANVNTDLTPDRSEVGDPTLQPAAADYGRLPNDRIGELSAFNRMRMTGETMDAALSLLDPGLLFDPSFRGIRIAGVADAYQGQRVWKLGRTTAGTWGVVGSTNVRFAGVDYDNAGVRVVFDHQIEVWGTNGRPFSEGGDSGSLVLDEHNNAVGLLFAGSARGGYTLMHPIGTVLDAFGVDLL
jgi:hypothetical protein